MSLRLEMLQVARLAPKLLGDSTGLVRGFLLGQQNEDGGFKDRGGKSDLYYTVFGMNGLLALEVSGFAFRISSPGLAERLAQANRYVSGVGDGAGLDFVHLCCLARCWGSLGGPANKAPCSPQLCGGILSRIERFRSRDGGYSPVAGAASGTAYGCFLGLGAYQDLQAQLPDPSQLVQCLKSLETEDGAWANEPVFPALPAPHSAFRPPQSKVGSTNATAAATSVLRNLALPINPSVGDWLLARAHPDGGFRATPNAPMPDLLSTATALHALGGMQVPFGHTKEKCLDFLDTLWTNDGGFHGHWGDDHLDCEYTFYGLLALGHLSL
jgi:Prenyltransferase and squalene oxidase repeat